MSHRGTSGLDCCFHEGSLTTTTISVEMVCAKLKQLKIFTSLCPDGIPARVLKHCTEVLTTPLSMLFNRSLIESRVPGGWKLATITPIFKKGDHTDPGNYRPVALLPIISKVMGCVLDDLIRQYLFERQLMSLHQHGFVRGRSCLTNLLHCHEEWRHLVENHQGVDVIFLDLSKAFDLVPYHNFLQKLQSLVYVVVFERRVTSQTTNSPTRNILNQSQNKTYQCCFNSCTIIRFMKNITEFTNLNSIRP